MGVLIKGVKMPVSCKNCPMLDWDLDYIKCKVTDRHFKMTEPWADNLVSDCPLVAVPEQAEPALEMIVKRLPDNEQKRWVKKPLAYTLREVFEIFASDIMYSPAGSEIEERKNADS